MEIHTYPLRITTTQQTDFAGKKANRRSPAPLILLISKETQQRLSKGSNTLRVATNCDQTDGQCLGRKTGLSADVLRISKSNTAMHCSLLVVLKGNHDLQGRNQFPQHMHIMDLLITLASENFHRSGQTIPTCLVINSWGQIMHLYHKSIYSLLCSGHYLVLKY